MASQWCYIFHSEKRRYFIAWTMKVIIAGAECYEVSLGQIQRKYQTFLQVILTAEVVWSPAGILENFLFHILK